MNASEAEVKKQFRYLANIYHPDKNGGTKESEEAFKIILTAYDVLSDKAKRETYDIRYNDYLRRDTNIRSTSNSSYPHEAMSAKESGSYRSDDEVKKNVNYSFWIFVVIVIVVYLYNVTQKYKVIRTYPEHQEQDHNERPETGEIDFKSN